MHSSPQLPQVLIITGDPGDHIAYTAASGNNLSLTFLTHDEDICNFVETIAHGGFVAIVIGLISSQRIRISPTNIVIYARQRDANTLIAGVCTNEEWQKMIVRMGANHAFSTPADAMDWILSELHNHG